MGDVVRLNVRMTECVCGWKTPKNVILSAFGTESLRESDILYNCPECGTGHIVNLQREKEG